MNFSRRAHQNYTKKKIKLEIQSKFLETAGMGRIHNFFEIIFKFKVFTLFLYLSYLGSFIILF